MDADGYGFSPSDRTPERLLADFRTLSPAGVERAAWGWDQHVGKSHQEDFKRAETKAVEAVEQNGLGDRWDELRRAIYKLTEGDHRALSWEVEHGDVSHKSEHAAYGAALALLAADHIDNHTRETLMRPLAEALPWLLPGTPPSPATERNF